jgi:hypothetical protein
LLLLLMLLLMLLERWLLLLVLLDDRRSVREVRARGARMTDEHVAAESHQRSGGCHEFRQQTRI